MTLIRTLATVCLGAAVMLTPLGASADDTEIYFQQGSSSGGAPLVMFYLQYTSELGSTVCNNVTGTGDLFSAGCGQLISVARYIRTEDYTDTKLTRFEVLRAVLKRVLAPLDKVKIGLMISHDDNNKCAGPTSAPGCSNGAYIVKGFTEFPTVPDTFDPKFQGPYDVTHDASGALNAKGEFFAKLDALPEPQGNLSHPHQTKEAYFELFRYLTGQGVYNAHNGWSDFATTTEFNLGSVEDVSTTVPNGTADIMWDTSIESGGNYISPLTDNCSRIFVINIVKGSGNSSDDSDAAISAPLSSGGMGFDVSKSDSGFVEMIRWLYDRDLADGTINGLDLEERQNITSFFIAEQRNQVDDEARAGGSGYALPLDDDPSKLITTIEDIFSQILSVSTTFVSASIPVNVFNRSEVLDNVYVALFQTDPDNKPQWAGDVKKLKLSITLLNAGQNTQYKQLDILDAQGLSAINNSDGRIKYSALTFWTNPYAWDVWGTYTSNEKQARDGRSVNRGGAGQRIPDFLGSVPRDATTAVPTETNTGLVGDRQLYTNSGGGLINLDADLSTAELLWPDLLGDASAWQGADDKPSPNTTWADLADNPANPGSPMYWNRSAGITLQQEAVNVLKFARGIDIKNADNNTGTQVRSWLFGDPLHSRPLPINYGIPVAGYTPDQPDIRILVGSNDGFLRMIRNIEPDLSEDGSEVWGFMPRSALAIQKKLMDNAAGSGHPYGVDGAPAAFMIDANQDGSIKAADNDKLYLFFGMRRGGHGYYALDITTPDEPTLKWAIDNTTPGFEKLGLTFSTPQVRMLKWDAYSEPRPVVIFAGGYDVNKDAPAAPTDDDEGNAIYIVDVETGDLVWKAEQGISTGSASSTLYTHTALVDSIPSDVTAVDTNADGLLDRFYVGDTGGRVWRGDLPGSDRTQWSVTDILSVGRHSSTGEDRRFFHAPDFVPATQWDSTAGHYFDYDAVVIGSGDRAHPLSTDVVNWMFMYKDFAINTGTPPSATLDYTQLDDVTDNCRQTPNCTVTTTLANGWRMALGVPGEKVLSAPLTYKGVVYFTAYAPNLNTSASCAPTEGAGFAYAVKLDDATAVFDYDSTSEGNERSRDMLSGGIPSDPVFVRYHGVEGIMNTDFQLEQKDGLSAWRTYWYLREE